MKEYIDLYHRHRLPVIDSVCYYVYEGGGEWIRTKCGTIKRSQLLPQCHMSDKELCSSQTDSTDCESSSSSEVAPATNTVLPTEVGSRLGEMLTSITSLCGRDRAMAVRGRSY